MPKSAAMMSEPIPHGSLTPFQANRPMTPISARKPALANPKIAASQTGNGSSRAVASMVSS